MTTTTSTTDAAKADALAAIEAMAAPVEAKAKADAKATAKADKLTESASVRGFRGVDSATTAATVKADATIAAAMAVDPSATTAATLPKVLTAYSGATDAVGTRGAAVTLALMMRAGEAIIAAVNADRRAADLPPVLRAKVTRSFAAASAVEGRAAVIDQARADAGAFGYGWGTLTDVIDSARHAHHVAAAYKADPSLSSAKAIVAAAWHLAKSPEDQVKAINDKARREADREARKVAAADAVAAVVSDGSGASDDRARESITASVDSIVNGLTAAVAAAAAAGKVSELTALRDMVTAALTAARAVPKAKASKAVGNVIAIEAGKRAAEQSAAAADEAATA